MKHILMLTLMVSLCCIGCGEGGLDLITRESIEDVVSCYESVETDGDKYYIALDKNCIDMELSGLGTPVTQPPAIAVEPTVKQYAIPAEHPSIPADQFTITEGDWEHIVTLPRDNLRPHRFRMVDEWIDPITSAYVAGKDFLFVLFTEISIGEIHFLLDQPAPPRKGSPLQVWHFPTPDAGWFRYWGRAEFQNREKAGFTVEFDTTPMFQPNTPGVKKPREYLFSPEFGTSLNGLRVGGGAAPEIDEGVQLAIYVR